MRILTAEQVKILENNEAYQTIINTPVPDFTKLRKDVDVFARWIAREHKKERESLVRVGV